MSEFISHTLSDLRGARQTWRVYLIVCAPAFIVAVIATRLVR